MVCGKHDRRPTSRYGKLDILKHQSPEEWPAEIELAADISVRFDDALRRIRHDRKIQPTVHAFERDYLARMLGAVEAAAELAAGRAKFLALRLVAIEYEFH